MSADIITAIKELIVQVRTVGCDATELSQFQQIVNVAGQLVREAALMTEQAEEWAADGFVSPCMWVVSHTGLPPERAKAVLREARSLEHMPHSQAAARDGGLDDTRIALLTGCQRTDPALYDADVDAMLVGLGGLAELKLACQRWKACAKAVNSPDPADLPEPPVEEPEWLRWVELLDGRHRIEAELNGGNFAVLRSAIDKIVGRMLNARRNGDPTLDGLHINHLKAQALVDLADHSLREKGGTVTRSDRYRINLVVRLAEDGTWDPETPLPVEGLCDSAFTRFVLGANEEILDVGRTTRRWPDAIANAIRLRDRHCTFPGCDRPAGWTDVHHCQDWHLNGPTSITNGTLLCRWHHTYLHKHHWTVCLDQHQKPVYRRPDGTIHQHHPQQPRPRPPTEQSTGPRADPPPRC